MFRFAVSLCVAAVISAEITYHRESTYKYNHIRNVSYAKTLVNCTDQNDASTCVVSDVPTMLDIWVPIGAKAPLPVLMTIHGGAYLVGDQNDGLPTNEYWAERGFLCFSIQYRLAHDLGFYPKSLKDYDPNSGRVPTGSFQPTMDRMYPAVRDAKAALRWIHANAHKYGGDPKASLTVQGSSAGSTTAIEIGVTGGDATFAGDYTTEAGSEADHTLVTTNLDQPTTITGLVEFWGGIFAADGMSWLDGRPRITSTSSVPTVSFHGTADPHVLPASGAYLVKNLTAAGVQGKYMPLLGGAHGCIDYNITLPDGTTQTLYQYAFDWMANALKWNVV